MDSFKTLQRPPSESIGTLGLAAALDAMDSSCSHFLHAANQTPTDRSSISRNKPASWLLRPPSLLLEASDGPTTIRNILVDEEEEVVTTLRSSKLDILQGVVRELHHQRGSAPSFCPKTDGLSSHSSICRASLKFSRTHACQALYPHASIVIALLNSQRTSI